MCTSAFRNTWFFFSSHEHMDAEGKILPVDFAGAALALQPLLNLVPINQKAICDATLNTRMPKNVTNDDYLREIDDDHHTINGPSAETASTDAQSWLDLQAQEQEPWFYWLCSQVIL